MTVRQPEFFGPFIVQVRKAAGPSQLGDRCGPQTRFVGYIFVKAWLDLLEEREVRIVKSRREEVDPTVVIVISEGDSHIRLRLAVRVHCDSGY